MSQQKVSVQASFPTLGILGIVFVTLKLCGAIDWSWWWVTCPFWICPILVLAIISVLGLFVLFGGLFAVIGAACGVLCMISRDSYQWLRRKTRRSHGV